MNSLLGKGCWSLNRYRGPFTEEAVRPVPPEDDSSVLADDASWVISEPDGESVRFPTTGPGMKAYRKKPGGP
jgi:hypothetical protein